MSTGTETAPPISSQRPMFGELVRHMSAVASDEVERALEQQRERGGRLGAILCEQGSLAREQVGQILRLQAVCLINSVRAAIEPARFPRRTYLSVCMPAYNESANIGDTLDGACAVLPELVEQFEVVVVDDGSRDGTGEVVRRYAEREPRVRLVVHPENRGYGAAVTSGLRAARGDLVFFTDSDGQFSFLDLVQPLVEIRRHDVVIGYRYQRAETGLRRLNAAAWNMLIRGMLGVRVRDLDCAYKLFRREVVDNLRLEATGAAISAEIMVQCVRGGWRICQLPVAHYARCHGAPTGAALKVIARAFRELPQLWRYRTNPDYVRRKADVRAAEPVATATPAILTRAPEAWSPAHRRTASVASGNGAPLRVCMLAACPFPANHGTPGSIREMAEAIADRGNDVHIVTYHMGEDIRVQGPRVHRITPVTNESSVVVGPTVRRPLYDLQMVSKTIQVVREHRIDLIHAHGYEAALVAWLARAATGVPVVCSAHNTMSDELPTYQFIHPRWLAVGLAGVLDAFVPRIGDRVIPHSANIERFYCQKGLRARTEPVVYKGIKLDGARVGDGTLVRQRYGLGLDPVILYAGVMNEFQRLDLLLDAVAQVIRHEPEVKLMMVVTIPSPRHEAEVIRRAAVLGIAESVILTTPQRLDQLPELLAACDVAVVPRPRSPGFPIKILNYMAAERPCVLFASSAGGLKHRENAYLVRPDTGDAMAAALLEVLRDRELRRVLASNALEFVRTHRDRRVTAESVCAAYHRVLGRAVPSRPTPESAPVALPSRTGIATPYSAWAPDLGKLKITDSISETLCEAPIERPA